MVPCARSVSRYLRTSWANTPNSCERRGRTRDRSRPRCRGARTSTGRAECIFIRSFPRRSGSGRMGDAADDHFCRSTAAQIDYDIARSPQGYRVQPRRPVIYLDSSVALAHLSAEDRVLSESIWQQPLISSHLLEYEVWTRIHARGFGRDGDAARALIGRVALIEMTPPVLARALEPFPISVRTLDALHLASKFVRACSSSSLRASMNACLLLHVPIQSIIARSPSRPSAQVPSAGRHRTAQNANSRARKTPPLYQTDYESNVGKRKREQPIAGASTAALSTFSTRAPQPCCIAKEATALPNTVCTRHHRHGLLGTLSYS